MTLRQELLKKWGGPKIHIIEIENGISKTRQGDILAFYTTVLNNHAVEYNKGAFAAEVNLTTFNTLTGSLPKRIERALYNLHAIKLTKDEKNELDVLAAEIGRICSNNHEQFGVHLSRRCWWEAGVCGDLYSCWFSYDRRRIETMHSSQDFLAFTVWSKNGNVLKPYADMIYPQPVNDLLPAGRMWLWFDHDGDNFAAVSPYGLPGEKQVALLGLMCPEHESVDGARVDYGRRLYDNGGYTFYPKGGKMAHEIAPVFRKGK